MNTKLYVPRLVWSHNNRPELRTRPNITFWSKTELRTCRTSQKTEQFANIELFVPRLMYNVMRIVQNAVAAVIGLLLAFEVAFTLALF